MCERPLICRICALERREGSSPILQRMDRCNTGWEGWGKGVALRQATVHCPAYVRTHAPTSLYHSARPGAWEFRAESNFRCASSPGCRRQCYTVIYVLYSVTYVYKYRIRIKGGNSTYLYRGAQAPTNLQRDA